jgi:hypothetical protein
MAGKSILDFGYWISDLRSAWLALAILAIGSTVLWADSYAESAAKIESLTSEEKAELLRKKERFDKLSDTEKKRLRDLHAQLAASPELEQLMGRYCNWLKNLSSSERAGLLNLPADQRIERIKQIVQRQENSRFLDYVEYYLPTEDRNTVRKWLETYALSHEDEIVKHMSWDLRRRVREAKDQQSRTRLLMVGLFFRPPNSEMPFPQKDEVDALVATLSEATRKELEKAKPAADRDHRGYEIVRAALASIAFPPPSQDELNKFYVSLPPDQKQRLEDMDPEDMRRELRRMFGFAKYRQGPGPGFPGGGPRGDGPRGPHPPGPPPPGFASPK